MAPRETPVGPTNQLRPYFSFHLLEAGFRVSDCQSHHKAEFAERLQELGQLTWLEILQAPRQGLGSEIISRNSIIPAIPPTITPDLRCLSFRFGQGARIIGFRDSQVFHVVWVDPNHRVYKG
jgi:hypothetical protein